MSNASDRPQDSPTTAEFPAQGLPATLGADPTGTSDALGLPMRVGDYEIEREIARGGMGCVFRARQVSLNRPVALKMILAGRLASPADRQRFRTEAEAAALLDHPNIVPIYEVGEHDGMPYFSMKLIGGGTLKADGGQWTVDGKEKQRAAARLVVKLARAVHYAHQRGILHRDLKPGNILLDAEGEPHVTDFGLAKRVGADSSATQTGSIVGTPSYMAPEQAEVQKNISTAADVYSLGAILYELLAGQPPFRAENPLETLSQVLHKEPVPPRRLRSGLDRDLETICLKCLEKDPWARYLSAADLAQDLEHWLAGEPIAARPAGTWEKSVKWMRRRPAVAGLLAVSAVSMIGLVVLLAIMLENAEARAKAVKSLAYAQERLERTNTDAHNASQRADEQTKLAEEKRQDVARLEKEAILERGKAAAAAAEAKRVSYAADMQFAHAAWVTDSLPRMLTLLDKHRPEDGEGSFEWRYLRRLAHPEGKSWSVGSPAIKDGKKAAAPLGSVQLFLSPAGRILAILAADNAITFLDLVADKVVGQIPPFADRVLAIRLPDELPQAVVVTADNKAKLDPNLRAIRTDINQGKEPPSVKYFLQGFQSAVQHSGNSTMQSPQPLKAEQLPGATNAPALLAIGSREFGLKDVIFASYCFGLSPDRKTLVVGGIHFRANLAKPGNIKTPKILAGVLFWDVEADQLLELVEIPNETMLWALNFNASGDTVAIGGFSGTVQMWDTKTRKPRQTIKAHTGPASALAFSPDGKLLATGGGDGLIKVWDAANGQIKVSFKWQAEAITSLVFLKDSRTLVSASNEGFVQFWDSGADPSPQVLRGWKAPVEAIVFNELSSLVTVENMGVVRSVDLTTSAITSLPTPKDGQASLRSVVLSPDGRWAIWRNLAEGPPQMRELATGKPHDLPKQLLDHAKPFRTSAFAFSNDGRSIACFLGPDTKGKDASRLVVWDAATNQERLHIEMSREACQHLIWLPDGNRVVCQLIDGAGAILVVDLRTKEMRRLRGRASNRPPALSPNGELLAHGSSKDIFLLDTTTWNEVRRLQTAGFSPGVLAFSPDGKRLASTAGESAIIGKGGIKLWDVDTGLHRVSI
jgi:eukaryotic-like serine/threonine-protein kinase